MGMDVQDMGARIGIRDLYARYCFALDAKDADALADCFTSDGAFVNEHGEFVGRVAVNELLLPAKETHYSINIEVLHGENESYKSRACFLLLHAESGAVATYGHYDDTCRLGDDDIWRFSRREVEFLWQSPQYAAGRTKPANA